MSSFGEADAFVPPDARLAEALSALAVPSRIALLRELRLPRIVSEIEVKASTAGSSTRNLARQTVRQHLDILLESGMVSMREAVRERGETTEFVVNHQRVYALAEELRSLARLRPAIEPGAPTAALAANRSAAPRRPCLVIVKGLDEGASFPLEPSERLSWIVGRTRAADVPLDFDPYISAENALISWKDPSHVIENLAGSRNGTSVNFSLLPDGARHTLQHGDVVGLGRTFLVYWA